LYGGWRKLKATIKDVAKEAGVSVGTASEILNNKGAFREETKRRVREAAERLGYRVAGVRRSLDQLKRVFVLYPEKMGDGGFTVNALYREFFEHIEQSLSNLGVNVFVAPNNTDLFPLNTAIGKGEVGGVIALGTGERHPSLLRLLDEQVPCVSVMRMPKLETRLSWVSVDHRRAAYDVVTHLVELGHRNISLVTLYDDTGYMADRIDGFRQALSDYGISSGGLIINEPHLGYGGLAARLFSETPMPTAVFASPDDLAVRVIDEARERGLRVPQDLSVVGFDDLDKAVQSSPKLTTIGYSRRSIGTMAVEALQMVARHGVTSVGIRIPHRLIVRESCAPPQT